MNPGDKVRVTKRGPVFGREGIFDKWEKVPGGGTPFCLVRFKNEKTGSYVMYFDAWDLEPVEEVIEPNASKTCDIEFTTGRRFKQIHNCTLPVGHTQDFHYCSVCGQEHSLITVMQTEGVTNEGS